MNDIFSSLAVVEMLAGMSLCHVAQALGIAESLLVRYDSEVAMPFPGNGKRCGENAELRRYNQQLSQVTTERDAFKSARETPNKSAIGIQLALESLFSSVFTDKLHQKPGF